MSYGSLLTHHSMVLDEVRNRMYLDAMRRVITPDSVVLDLGAGLGVLGLLAAKLGARRVYCVEPSQVCTHIATLAKANGVADRVVALRGRIEDVTLPEQVDVILSVFTGNLLFTEGLMPSLYFARDRYLKPAGAMIPDRARLIIAGVEAPKLYADTAGRYRCQSLGIDYSSIAVAAANGLYTSVRGDAAPSPITQAAIATELDLRTTHEERVHWQGNLSILRDGELHGLLGWIEIQLGETWLSTGPGAEEVHWRPGLLPVETPIPVSRGESVDAKFHFIDDGQMIWSLFAGGSHQRQSTVLGNPDAAIDVMLSAETCSNSLGQDGEFVARVLGAMQSGKSNKSIAADLYAVTPERFKDEREALKRVGLLSARYRSHPMRKA